jgi:hypothetical protein
MGRAEVGKDGTHRLGKNDDALADKPREADAGRGRSELLSGREDDRLRKQRGRSRAATREVERAGQQRNGQRQTSLNRITPGDYEEARARVSAEEEAEVDRASRDLPVRLNDDAAFLAWKRSQGEGESQSRPQSRRRPTQRTVLDDLGLRKIGVDLDLMREDRTDRRASVIWSVGQRKIISGRADGAPD